MRPRTRRQFLIGRLEAEMGAQDDKWGWPRLFRRNKPCWQAILGEEIGEVAREKDPEKRIAELIQVAAVALSWAQAIEEQGEGS